MTDQPTPTDSETPSQAAPAGNPPTPPLWLGELQRICAGLEAEMDGGFSPAARSHIRRLRAWTNMLHLDCANDAPSAIHPSQRNLPEPILQALRFYAGGHHLVIDENEQEFESVSGEPVNWLMSTKDGDGTMVEDGSIARMALQGRSLVFEQDPADAQPAFPQPVAGERFTSQPDRVQLPMEIIQALSDGLSVCRSVSTSKDRQVVRDGSVMYMQTEDWCRWLAEEVAPRMEKALAGAKRECAPQTVPSPN